MAEPITVELPAIYLDDLVEDAVTSITDSTPVLINLDPESGEVQVPKSSNIQLDIATLDVTGSISLADTKVYVRGVLAFDAGTFQPGFNGPESAYSNPQTDVLRVIIDPTTDYGSEELVLVRAVSRAVLGGMTLDEDYTFTAEDTAAPHLLTAEAIDLNRIRVTFNESVEGTLDPLNWTLDRLGDYITPIVSASIVAVVAGAALNTVDLVTDIPLTPGGNYQLTAANITDIFDNEIQPPDDVVQLVGWTPPVPAGRAFDLYKKFAQLNRSEDKDVLDLLRFVGCLQEVCTLLLYDIDRFVDSLDPDTAPEANVDAMLSDLGNPFNFDLTLTDKRRLVQVLVAMYQLKGTEPGIKNVIRFFLGFEVTVDLFNSDTGWLLGENELGVDTILGTSNESLLYSFAVIVQKLLSDEERRRVLAIVSYMRPAHTHFVRLDEPPQPAPTPTDHMELGISLLGENWLLH